MPPAPGHLMPLSEGMKKDRYMPKISPSTKKWNQLSVLKKFESIHNIEVSALMKTFTWRQENDKIPTMCFIVLCAAPFMRRGYGAWWEEKSGAVSHGSKTCKWWKGTAEDWRRIVGWGQKCVCSSAVHRPSASGVRMLWASSSAVQLLKSKS